MKPYSVEVRFVMVVMAESTLDAYVAATSSMHEAWGDADPEVNVMSEISSVDQLESIGWNGDCLPYDGDGETRLAAIIDALPAPRDDKTVDMFAEQSA